jgi:L-arabinose isomerase
MEDEQVNSAYKQLRVGLLGVGLEAYWRQFDGLEERLNTQLKEIEGKLHAADRLIVNMGMVDTPQKAVEAGHSCRRLDIDLLMIYVSTYALSATVLPIVLRAQVPVIFLNLQPTGAIDYAKLNSLPTRGAMTGEWLAYCSSCPLPEFSNVLKRLDLQFHQVIGTIADDPQCWRELEDLLLAAQVKNHLSHSTLGLMGHYYSGMLDIATDLVQLSGKFGLHIEHMEVGELSELREDISEEVVQSKLKEFENFFEIGTDCEESELRRAALTAIAFDRLVEHRDIDMLAYFYKGSGVPTSEDTMSSIILGTSMHTGRGVPVAGEYEIKNVVAMKILDGLGAGGSFSEYYAVDFESDVVLFGHDGPGHIGIAEGKIKVRPLQVYHGKVGKGLSVEMSVKHGPVTLLSLVEDNESRYKFLVAEGESVPGKILEIGNTNSRYRFPIGARSFIERWNSHGPAHHCAIGVGHLATRLEKVARLIGLGFVQIC